MDLKFVLQLFLLRILKDGFCKVLLTHAHMWLCILVLEALIRFQTMYL